ncbi:hypothetical protein GCM10025868_18340 [Angustibacter aerolatus]|uniref:Uncharacterized protein n=1 Tax=Angustibacter aerolatus TaxID=1162965 RepID=A0ABQ6JHJ3_9ACTN|nr:hypothetical protein GCM10025868_18340 [Angustibacter aerolatus]
MPPFSASDQDVVPEGCSASASSTVSWIEKTFVRPVIRNTLSTRSCEQTRLQGAVVGAHALEPAHEHAEAGGVEELDALHVDDQVVVPGGHEAVEWSRSVGAL